MEAVQLRRYLPSWLSEGHRWRKRRSKPEGRRDSAILYFLPVDMSVELGEKRGALTSASAAASKALLDAPRSTNDVSGENRPILPISLFRRWFKPVHMADMTIDD